MTRQKQRRDGLFLNYNEITKRIKTAGGAVKAELVLKNADVVNVFTNEIMHCDVAVSGGFIAGLGEYSGEKEIDCTGLTVLPGLIDAHVHVESSMLSPRNFEKTVLPHGVTTVITDPHEIANVAGTDGIKFMLEAARELTMDMFVMLPSCVPAGAFDESGAVLDGGALEKFYEDKNVLGLAEMMDYFSVVNAVEAVLKKTEDAKKYGGRIDGHAPGLTGKMLNAYCAAGIQSDHECTVLKEAKEKLAMGQWIMIRQGTAARNFEALRPLCEEPYYQRCMFATDDRHPEHLLEAGSIDDIIRLAVSCGVDPIRAVRMGTLHAAQYFGLSDRGAVAPGYRADLLICKSLESMEVCCVFKSGKEIVSGGLLCDEIRGINKESGAVKKERIYNSFNIRYVSEESLKLKQSGRLQRVIQLVPHEIITTEMIVPFTEKEGFAPGVDIENDIIKAAVFERHLGTGHVGLGFVKGYGLKKGAVATSVSHDSHNLTVVGTNDADIALAANTIIENNGGLAIVADGKVIEALALPVAGLMSEDDAPHVAEKMRVLKNALGVLGIPPEIDPFMTLAFIGLSVIPSVRINTLGVIDVNNQRVVPCVFD